MILAARLTPKSPKALARLSWEKLLMNLPPSTRRLSKSIEIQGNARAGEYYLDMPRPIDLSPTTPIVNVCFNGIRSRYGSRSGTNSWDRPSISTPTSPNANPRIQTIKSYPLRQLLFYICYMLFQGTKRLFPSLYPSSPTKWTKTQPGSLRPGLGLRSKLDFLRFPSQGLHNIWDQSSISILTSHTS